MGSVADAGISGWEEAGRGLFGKGTVIMKRKFNTEGQCAPELHYMVRLDGRMREIKERYVEPGSYFVINRGRQYGKTTTLWALEEY